MEDGGLAPPSSLKLGPATAEAGAGFVSGIAVYQITDAGVMAHADIAGTKYWKDEKLNEAE